MGLGPATTFTTVLVANHFKGFSTYVVVLYCTVSMGRGALPFPSITDCKSVPDNLKTSQNVHFPQKLF